MGANAKSQSLYELIDVDRSASKAEIRKAYHRLALASHPDKHPNDPSASERFQSLQRIKECLLDDERRAVYDETGIVGDEESSSSDRFRGKSYDELHRFFREMHRAVTSDAIDEYEAQYRGSEEEVADLTAFYQRYGGRMQNLTECILFAEESDLSRFKLILDRQLELGVIEVLKPYLKFKPPPGPSTAEVIRRAQAKLAARTQARSTGAAAGDSGPSSLSALIRGRQASRAEAHDVMIDALEAKYAPKAKALRSSPTRRGVQKISRKAKGKGKV